ncbi:flagellar hook protein FlgE [Duganella callida]|uniref:Flagellar hook protein FlgE n=1 Tax=Duganella callida TaxID=2561932 RepID=A0A4Y9SKH1_9BURK|nr:flagellar hook-basal body complex protein [Duganella callida]TFW23606.1 flagellar hook-basal body complex protein [Duganella callida]
MSFDIALSGIQAINDALDTTSHNIANAGTYGFKSSRANFSSLVAGSQVTGVQVGSVTQSIGLQGGILNTGLALDASINGRGFFMARDASTGETQYTRVGIFDASKDGFLVDASGRKVQGYTVNPATGKATSAPGDIAIQTGSIPAVASQKNPYVGNMSADWKVTKTAWDDAAVTPATPPDSDTFTHSSSSYIYDTLGGKHTLTQYFARTDDGSGPNGVPGSVDVHYVLDGAVVGSAKLVFDSTGQMTADPTNGFTVPLALAALPTGNAGTFNDVSIDYTGTTGFAGEGVTTKNAADGYASGTYNGLSLGKDGSIIASYSNDQKQTIGRLAIATFPDEGALTQISDTSWVASQSSGEALVNAPGEGLGGTINVATLEQSNVDITSELVGLMTSQRNYQANSKVIQTESTMLQSLMQAI